MRSLVFLLLACVVIAGPVTSAASIEASSVSCTDDTYPGLTGAGLAVVEVSGHGDTRIDGTLVEPAGTGMYKNYSTKWYATTDGSHMVYITREGFLPYTSYISACAGKVSYVYYDQAAHPYPGRTVAVTATTMVPVTTTVIPTTLYGGESADLRAALAAGATVPPGSLGSLSVTTDPAGAAVYIDGVRQGVSPATIPGIAPGSHTLTLKLEGYEDLTLPVSISAGSTQYYSSALKKSGAVAPASTTRKSSTPGFGAAVAACVAGALLLLRKSRP